MSEQDWLQGFVGRTVVAEIGDRLTVFGHLALADAGHLRFTGADLHDQAAANSTAEAYAIEAKAIGVRASRAVLVVPRARLVAISLLEDVVSP